MPVGSSSKIHRDDDENNLQGPLPQSGVSLPALVGDVASRANDRGNRPACKALQQHIPDGLLAASHRSCLICHSSKGFF